MESRISKEFKMEKREEIIAVLRKNFETIYFSTYSTAVDIDSSSAPSDNPICKKYIAPKDLIDRLKKLENTLNTLSPEIIFDMALENDVLFKIIENLVTLSNLGYAREGDIDSAAFGVGFHVYLVLSYTLPQ